MRVLGVTHPISWNTAAVLIEDGKILAAAEEERFVRIKHAPRMIPFRAIEYVLEQSKVTYNDIDIIAISWDGPKNDNDVERYLSSGIPTHSNVNIERSFWLESLEKENYLMNYLRHYFTKSKIFFVKHHLAHAASACYVSGFDKSLFFTTDGRGEVESGLIGIYDKGEFEIIGSLGLDESLGNMYGLFTTIIGYASHSEEGKIMGLAPYGKPIDSLCDIIRVTNEGKIQIDWKRIISLGNINFEGYDPTQDQRKDLAASAQYLLEKCALLVVSYLKSISNNDNICLAGGTALNIDMNGALLKSGLIKDIFVQPASNDAGCALGAALYIYRQFSSTKFEQMKHAYLGPEYESEQIKKLLDNSGLKYRQLSDVSSEISNLISKDKIVGWMQGRSEFGSRALGSRSLLANPKNPDMWKKVNKVKGREWWRPLSPSILEENLSDYCENCNVKSPFMLLRFDVKEDKIKDIPAVVHVDKSARPQSVSKESNMLYWNLLKEFENSHGVPVLINTSLNLRGEPIVNTPFDAIRTFFSSEIDYMCIDKYLIYK